MPNSTGTRIAIFLSAAIALVAVWVATGKFDFTYTKAIVSASSIVIIGLLAFDSWAWRFWPFRLIVRKPILHGTWKVEQRTSYEPRAHETMEAYLVIDQTFSGIRQIRGLYEISNSHSLTADLSVDRSHCALSFIFRTEAGTMHRDGNPPSRGASVLRVGRHPRLHLQGDYWMERGTKGDVRSVGYSPKLYGTFESAKSAEFESHVVATSTPAAETSAPVAPDSKPA
jgi:hypothetical protein